LKPSVPYFSYGSNMAPAGMEERCAAPSVLGIATVPGYRFRIAKRGYATMVPDPGSMVYGLLWSLTDEDFAALDQYEGVPAGHYTRTTIPVQFRGKPMEAQIYLAADPAPGKPRPGYLEMVIQAARDLSLPPEYIRELEGRA
jgi:gamma-glutamylcyclotransferase (GGCT)/AIG2-like uncharacterized protein YtfP